jgi:hypothetical protein
VAFAADGLVGVALLGGFVRVSDAPLEESIEAARAVVKRNFSGSARPSFHKTRAHARREIVGAVAELFLPVARRRVMLGA